MQDEVKNTDGRENAEGGVREYIAFISYRHKDLDKFVAKRIHSLVERYVIPKELQAGGRKRLGLVFRDEEELPVSSNLTESIQMALDHAQYLIVVCTPNTPESLWVEREIAYFLQAHDRAHVIGVLADGTPDESFPKLLTTIYAEDGTTPIGTVEPLAANLTNNAHQFDKRRIKKEAVRLYAALLGCPFDSLWQRERRYKMRCAVALMALVMTIALAFSLSIYLKNLQISAKNQQIEEQNGQIQQQNAEITAQYEEIQQKNAELRRSEAEVLIREAGLLYDRGDMLKAARAAVSAVSTPEGMANYAADAEYELNRALGAGQYDNVFRTVGVLEQEKEIQDMLISGDNSRVFTLDERGYVRCFSAREGVLLWTGDGLSRCYHGYTAQRQRITELPEAGLLISCNEDAVTALHAENGSLAWNYTPAQSSGVDFACYSKDKKKLAVIADGDYFHINNRLVILNTEDGSVLQEISLEEIYGNLKLRAHGNGCGAFSEDGRYLAGVVYGVPNYYTMDSVSLFLADLEEGTVRILYEEQIESPLMTTKPFTIGVVLHAQEQNVLMLHYDKDEACVRMDQIFWDGSLGERSAVPVTLPDRDLSGPYPSNFVSEEAGNGCILASCGEMALIYRWDNGALVSSKIYAAGNVLNIQWMDAAHYTRSLMMDTGAQYALYEKSGYTIAQSLDQIHIKKLAISEGYCINNGQFGHSLDGSAVAVVVCDDNYKKAYLMGPAKDAQIGAAEWFAGDVMPQTTHDFRLRAIGEDTLYYVVKRDGKIAVKFIEAGTQKVIAQYLFETEKLPKHLLETNLVEGYVWPDLEHVTVCVDFNKLATFDLKTGTLTAAFDEQGIRDSHEARLADGEILQASVSLSDGVDLEDRHGKLLYRIGQEEAQVLSNTGEKNWLTTGAFKDGFVKAGGNGYVLVGQFAAGTQDEPKMETFYFRSARDGSEGEIADDCPATKERMLVMGEERPLFATADEDGYLRIYDMQEKAIQKKYLLPVIRSEVQDVFFCRRDQVIAVWSLGRKLYLYDVESGALLFEGGFDRDTRDASFEESIRHYEDPKRNRLYFVNSENLAICVDTTFWKKTADFTGMDAFCSATNEIYKLKSGILTFQEEGNDILCCPAYTLEELVQKVK